MEKIYTIPVNEAFDRSAADKACGCPYCSLYNLLEKNEAEAILGAAMMEPDVRIKSNELGYCGTHLKMMMAKPKRLPQNLLTSPGVTDLISG